MILRGSTDSIESLRIIRCTSMKPTNSAGAVAGTFARSAVELVAHACHRGVEACDLLGYLVRRHEIVRRLELRVRDQVRVADRDPAGDRNAVQCEGHVS